MFQIAVDVLLGAGPSGKVDKSNRKESHIQGQNGGFLMQKEPKWCYRGTIPLMFCLVCPPWSRLLPVPSFLLGSLWLAVLTLGSFWIRQPPFFFFFTSAGLLSFVCDFWINAQRSETIKDTIRYVLGGWVGTAQNVAFSGSRTTSSLQRFESEFAKFEEDSTAQSR